MIILLLAVISIESLPPVHSSDHFEVLKISGVPYPYSDHYAATINGTFHKELTEFTVCYRFLIESYNEKHILPFIAEHKHKGASTKYFADLFEDLSNNQGWGTRGFQGGLHIFIHGVPKGGMAEKRFPVYHHFNNARPFQISTWNHLCTSYSSKLNIIHMFQDGLKVYSFHYKDPQDIPFPANTFDSIHLGQNLRGLVTDVNIYSTFFDEETTRSLTLGCGESKGDIFAWDVNKVNISQDVDSQLNVTIERIDKSEICLMSEPTAQEPSTSAKMSDKKRYKQPSKFNSSFVDYVLEVITDPFYKPNSEAVDRCLRLNGELMPVPQTEEEEALFDKTLWDYMNKRIENNLSIVNDKVDMNSIWFAGQTPIREDEFSTLSRESTFANAGVMELFNPITGVKLKPYEQGEIVMSQQASYYNYPQLCCMGWNSRKKAIRGNFYMERTKSLIENTLCTMMRHEDFICMFLTEPTYRLRGLCKNAVMDTQYKLAEHKPGDLSPTKQDTRGYVGPKGWIIERNRTDKRWRMSHYYYTELTLTMLDHDSLPIGRHKWLVENNACKEGQTTTQVLQLSGCEEDQFTCNDGKCLDIHQRCNNIEVTSFLYKENHNIYVK